MNTGDRNLSKVVVVTGPTAAGKTEFGINLAKMINGEIVSVDSMQIYKYMDIGTAKPSVEEMQGIRHHMIDVVPPWENYSVARYVEDASRCIDDITVRNKIPVLVGGTGLYTDSLLKGCYFSAIGNNELRSHYETQYDIIGGESMLNKLRVFDEDSAVRLHSNDKKRIVRAFEVYNITGKSISQHNRETKNLPERYDTVKFSLMFSDRALLYDKIDRRVDDMISNGLENEVHSLLKMGVNRENTSMQAIGYKEFLNAIFAKTDTDNVAEIIKTESRRYAKRQLTWLRRDLSIHWIYFDIKPDISEIAEKLKIEIGGNLREAK